MGNRKLKAALRAARRGFAVLLIHWIEGGRCSCRNPTCSSVAKHPITAHGVHDATKNKSVIRTWWAQYPEANIGVATGRVSDLIVVDVDPRHGGDKSLQEFVNQNGPLPNGPVVRTGGGGTHYYFKYSDVNVRNKVGILPGIDVRADGGYVLYPTSVHQSGNEYLWASKRSPKNVSIPQLPAVLAQFTKAPPVSYERAINEGRRHVVLTSLAGTMRSRGMSFAAVQAALLEDNVQRCVPPLPQNEVSSIARSISRYQPDDSFFLSAASYEREEAERKMPFKTGKQIADEKEVAVPWIARPWIASGAITEVVGRVKEAGKTTFLTHLVYAVLNGLLFLGEPTTRTQAMYLTEQGLTTFRIAMERAHLLGLKDITVLTWTDTIGVSWAGVVRSTVAKCKQLGAKLLIVDTLPQFAGLPGDSENHAGNALEALKPLQVAASEGLAIVVVRHERKTGGSVGSAGRGSSAFAGAVDVVLALRRPEGNQPRNVRVIQAVSRFDAPDELLIELTEGGYRSLGVPGELAKEQKATEVYSFVPDSKRKAATIIELSKVSGKKRAHLQKILDELMKDQRISRLGEGRKNDPYRYFRA